MSRKSKQAELDKIRNRNKAKIAESKAATTTLRGQTAASGRKRDAMKMSKASDLEGARKKGREAANKFRSARAKAPISSGASGGKPTPTPKPKPKPKPKAKKSTTPPLLKKPSVGVLKPKAAPKLPFSASVKGTGVKKKPNPRHAPQPSKADALRKQIATLKQRSAQSGAGAAAQIRIQSLQKQLAALTGK